MFYFCIISNKLDLFEATCCETFFFDTNISENKLGRLSVASFWASLRNGNMDKINPGVAPDCNTLPKAKFKPFSR